MEIIVDAYGLEVQAMGWYCYLKDTIKFLIPFDGFPRIYPETQIKGWKEGRKKVDPKNKKRVSGNS